MLSPPTSTLPSRSADHVEVDHRDRVVERNGRVHRVVQRSRAARAPRRRTRRRPATAESARDRPPPRARSRSPRRSRRRCRRRRCGSRRCARASSRTGRRGRRGRSARPARSPRRASRSVRPAKNADDVADRPAIQRRGAACSRPCPSASARDRGTRSRSMTAAVRSRSQRLEERGDVVAPHAEHRDLVILGVGFDRERACSWLRRRDARDPTPPAAPPRRGVRAACALLYSVVSRIGRDAVQPAVALVLLRLVREDQHRLAGDVEAGVVVVVRRTAPRVP